MGPHTTTLNLSRYTLSETDNSLLNLDLSFIPTYTRLKQSAIQNLFQHLSRSLKLRDFFNDKGVLGPRTFENLFIEKSDWLPPKISQDTNDPITRLEKNN